MAQSDPKFLVTPKFFTNVKTFFGKDFFFCRVGPLPAPTDPQHSRSQCMEVQTVSILTFLKRAPRFWRMGRDATSTRLCGAAVSLLLTVAAPLAAAQENWDIAHCGKKCAPTRAPACPHAGLSVARAALLVQLPRLSPAAAAPVR